MFVGQHQRTDLLLAHEQGSLANRDIGGSRYGFFTSFKRLNLQELKGIQVGCGLIRENFTGKFRWRLGWPAGGEVGCDILPYGC